jgi:hypothetical protein
MALQTSGSISVGDLASEFGGAAPHSLSEYYGAASGIPASGAIALSAFYGASSSFATKKTWTCALTRYRKAGMAHRRPVSQSPPAS